MGLRAGTTQLSQCNPEFWSPGNPPNSFVRIPVSDLEVPDENDKVIDPDDPTACKNCGKIVKFEDDFGCFLYDSDHPFDPQFSPCGLLCKACV